MEKYRCIPAGASEDPAEQYLLVHFRSPHVDNITPRIDFRERYPSNVRKSRDAIYNGIGFLSEKHGLGELYVEGWRDADEMIKEKKEALEMIESGRSDEGRARFSMLGLQEYFVSVKTGMKIIPAEGREIYGKACEYAKRAAKGALGEEERTKAFLSVYDYREEEIMKSLIYGKKHVMVIEMGSSHAFGGRKSCGPEYRKGERIFSLIDNIRFFSEGQNRAIYLIEVRPDS